MSPARGTGKNRAALLEAAIACLAELGYARTTARDLAARSGANLGAIVYHYGSKEQLLSQALAEGFRRWFRELASIALAADRSRPDELLARAAEDLEASFQRNRWLALAFVEALAQVQHAPELRRELAASYEEAREGLGAMLGAATEAGVDTRALASGVIASFDGLLLQWLVDPERTPSASEILAAALAAARQVGAAAAASARS
jgi:AcrR family transcriptional regulator